MAVSGQPGNNHVAKMGISEEDIKQLKYLMEQEQSEAAVLDVIKYWKRQHLPTSMELKGIYDSLIAVGFDYTQATMLTIAHLNNHENSGK